MKSQGLHRVFFCNLLNALVFLGLFVAAISLPVQQAVANDKYASFVIDADTGMILHQRYATKKLHPASLTKVMTLLMLFEAIESGKVRLNDQIHISSHAASMVPSKLGLPAGSSISVRDAISALVTKSANDIAAAVAEHLAGSERNFAYMMTRRAKDIGMRDTHFMNASGLHDPRQVSTARDMATMARYVIKRYPSQYKYFSTKNFSFRGQNYHNHNRLMETYQGMDGMKTGYVNASGFNLIASAVRGNRRVIGVVFGGRTTATRNAHMAQLLDTAFSQLGEVRQASASAPARASGAAAMPLMAAIPTPAKKPNSGFAIASASNASASRQATPSQTQPQPAAAVATREQVLGQIAHLKVSSGPAVPPPYVDGSELMGQGDIDEVLTSRPYTGFMTAAAHTAGGNHPAPAPRPSATPVSLPAATTATTATQAPAAASAHGKPEKGWSIQVGAFQSKTQSTKALKDALQKLPQYYAQATPQIMPLQTANNTIYRARLSGYTSHDAYAACAYIRECITIAP